MVHALPDIPPSSENTLLEADLCIVGAGPVGGTLACRLAAAGLRVAIIDKASLPPMEHPAFDGRAYAIAAGVRNFLAEAGLWDLLPDMPCPIHGIRVSDGKVGRPASPLHLHFDHAETGQDRTSDQAFGWMVEARALRRALNQRLHDDPSIHLFAPADYDIQRTEEGVIIHIHQHGQTPVQLRCALVIAAEGRQSPLRQEAGIRVTKLGYDQIGMVCAVAHEHPHNNIALEHFLPGGPFAQLPMTGIPGSPNISAIVWTERGAVAQRLATLDDARYTKELQRRLGDHLGEIRLLGRRWSYPLSALHAHRYYDTRLLLVGDAAHGIHPIAGQGLNLGFRDAMTLADLLIEAHHTGQDMGNTRLLTAYQAARRPANLAMLLATDALDRLFSTDRRSVRLARDLGIAAVHRLRPLKQFFMRQAMG
ncbi:UbiH/UbiF/VisC/COQ6 family ubiquinone biosynthesis hydroxylase [Granulibacter bethesdensis]|uniref:UbiH/UbiF/VisC/COQ6 family ubiquinone biosynthesis hydroxylase n=1 Tax=Granulibacter bethesdensis TaxID=364410 RepID=UPI0003F1FAE3|nr:UbiH/UbiF/VisC/COQ6 family ubiquinone biosynthesis hydroxylase [Granulibacter bethesdensis]AHJ65382.1 2-polyprenyl-6-methoxyphenol hydroxylase [Granulibacter bethesdensis CGDNIH4]